MSIYRFMRNTGAKMVAQSPKILTALGCGGVVGTVLFAIRATPKAELIVDQIKNDPERKNPTKLEIAKEVVPVYIPTILMASVTIGCIVGANRVSSKHNAALAGLYSASELALQEYQKRVIERIGENKEREIRDELATEKIRERPVSSSEVVITGKGSSLCYDTLSERYFESDYNSVRNVENIINSRIISDISNEGVSVNDMFYELGLKDDYLGSITKWDFDHKLHFVFTSSVADDGRPCLVLNYEAKPATIGDKTFWY